MTRKALATIGSGAMERVLDEAMPTFAEFAERHSYDVVAFRSDEHAKGRPPSWGKVRLLRGLLERYDVVLWLDADTIVLDSSVDPADLLGPDDYQALVLLEQQGRVFPTCGVWLLRSTPKAKAFLDAVWAMEEHTDHHWWEQAAVVQLLGYLIPPDNGSAPTEWSRGTVLLDETWNCMPLVSRTLDPCRIRHYAGEKNAVRRRQMRTDRHALAAARSSGWLLRWHAIATAAGRLRWRVWDGPLGTYGLRYRGQHAAYNAATAIGLVKVVRHVRRARARR